MNYKAGDVSLPVDRTLKLCVPAATQGDSDTALNGLDDSRIQGLTVPHNRTSAEWGIAIKPAIAHSPWRRVRLRQFCARDQFLHADRL